MIRPPGLSGVSLICFVGELGQRLAAWEGYAVRREPETSAKEEEKAAGTAFSVPVQC